MSAFELDDRSRMQVELAVSGAHGDKSRMREEERRASRLGLSGAEIDAARNGRSFDVLTSILLAVAMAPDLKKRRLARERAIKAGLGESVLREIDALTGRSNPPCGLNGETRHD